MAALSRCYRAGMKKRALVGIATLAVIVAAGGSHASGAEEAAGKAADAMPGTIYLQANFERKLDSGETERTSGVIAVDPNTGEFQELGPIGYRVRISPDGKRFATAQDSDRPDAKENETDVFVIDLENFETQYTIDGATLPSWSGNRLVYNVGGMGGGTGWRGKALLADLATAKTTESGVPATDEVDDWSADGEWLVTVSDRHPPHGSGYQIYVMHPDGSEQRRLTEGKGLNCYPRFCPATHRIVYKHHRRGFSSLNVVDVDGKNRRELLHTDNGLADAEGACWSPDGKYLAVVRFDWSIKPNGRWTVSNPALANYRLEILDADGTSRGIVKLVDVEKITWLGHPDWR